MPKKSASDKPLPLGGWLALTDEDIREWAGAKTFARGFAYFKYGAVIDLRSAADGGYLAWVQGTHRYATRVALAPDQDPDLDRVQSECSCPVQYGCKHAVAVVLSCVQAAKKGFSVATISDTDRRLAVLEGDEPPPSHKHSPRRRSIDKKLEEMLRSKTKDELVALLMAAAEQESDLRRDLEEALIVESGQWDTLLKDIRSEMLSLTDEEAWSNPWSNEGSVPDYSRFKKRLQTLLDNGYSDQLIELGKDLLDLGTQQVEHSNDEGETCEQITGCLDIIAKAVRKSAMPQEKKLLTAIDFLLADDYSMCDGFDAVLQAEKSKAVWSTLANELLARLAKTPAPASGQSGWRTGYARSRLGDFAALALDNASRREEATELYVGEARLAGKYVRGVDRLLKLRRFDQAHHLALEGLGETAPQFRGTISELSDRLQQIAHQQKDWPLAAAYEADRFFSSPSLAGYKILMKVAKKAKCEPAVRAASWEFLETGSRPDGDTAVGRKAAAGWTLPEPRRAPAAKSATHESSPPHFDVLLELAIDNKQPTEVLKWHAAFKKSRRQTFGTQSAFATESKVAKAIENELPTEAAAIYLQLAEAYAAQTNTSVYPDAVSNLVKAKRAFKAADRGDFWPEVLSDFREKHRRKSRLMADIEACRVLRANR